MNTHKHLKYVVSIDNLDGTRISSFYSKNKFNNTDFLKFGVNGKELPTDQYYNFAVKNSFPPLSPAELGCTLSHLQIIENFLNTDANYAFIFEDDIILKDNLNFDEKLDFLGENFIFSLGGIELSLCNKARGTHLKNKYNNRKIMKINKLSFRFLYYTMGYVIDRVAAKKILEYHQDYCKKADDWVGFLERNPTTSFYVTDMIIHPDLNDISTKNSLIGATRHPQQYYIYLSFKLFLKILMRRIKSIISIPFFKKF